ncbi:hypothetical protein HII31_09241 [Pseudocercospora fuligena]|uniref:F-box domain-containing protein n=1 Tax=Pseudocercospora fuligena TaxID=685502 RepID=A0A8H6RG17_9PEZI|nr:hypothetical protein HII31_09241 [Pseudocercospora fuligena]
MNTHNFEPLLASIEAKKRRNQAERTHRISEMAEDTRPLSNEQAGMLATPTQNASQNANTSNITPSPLQTLPGELIEKIALFTADEDLRRFRMTSRSVQNHTAEEFAVRHLTKMRFQLNEEDLRATLDVLRYEDFAKHVESVKVESFTTSIALTPTEVDLLEHLLTRLTTATHIEITDMDLYFNSQGPQPAPATSQLLRALCKNTLPNITSLAIERANVTRVDLERLFAFYSDTLTNMKLEEIHFENHDWDNILAFMRDKMHLEKLTLRCLYRDPRRTILDLNLGRIEKFLRNPVTKKIELYVMNFHKAEMSGEWAIKLGLNKILELEGSALFDAFIPWK